MSLLSGIFNISQNPAELNMRSFAGTILRLFPNGSAPMFALTSQTGKSTAKSTQHGYFSKTMTFIKTTITTAIASGATTNLEVASSAGMTPGMVLFFPSVRENVRVTAIVDATNITVKRGFGRTAAQASIADDAVLFQVGTAFEEGSVRPTARMLATTYIPNYTQIFRNAWGLTDTARASMSELGYSNVAESRKDCSMFHATDIESAIIWGQPVAPAVGPGGQPLHATQGVIDAMEQYAPGNTNAASSTTTYDQLVALLEPAFAYSTDMANPKERTLFGDAQAIRVLNAIGVKSGQVQITTSETSFGMNFTKFKFYKGSINLIEHPLMNGLGQAGSALVMDMPALKLAYLEGRDTKAEEYGSNGKILESGVDGVGGSLTTELAVELINPYSCAYITGLTAAA
jgi:hypothetical protein